MNKILRTEKIKRIAVLGSTGSIGRQTLDVVRANPELFSVVSLTANTNAELLISQKNEFSAKYAGLSGVTSHNYSGLASGSKVLTDAVREGVDIVIVATAGIAALEAVLLALENGIDVAIANKEAIIAGGELINDKLKNSPSNLIPVDSEHSAILQCISNSVSKPEKIILTASGGPFFKYTSTELENVTLESALKHPKWSMGKKITIDSATMMNKGFEIIEAAYLFGFSEDKIEVLVHPQSIVHSMVEFIDKSVIANLGAPDMRIPIQYALTYPERAAFGGKALNLAEIRTLEFYCPDNAAFPTMQLARAALRKGGSAPLVLCAADEACVNAFINKSISFSDIFKVLHKVCEKYPIQQINSFIDAKNIFSDAMCFTENIINNK